MKPNFKCLIRDDVITTRKSCSIGCNIDPSCEMIDRCAKEEARLNIIQHNDVIKENSHWTSVEIRRDLAQHINRERIHGYIKTANHMIYMIGKYTECEFCHYLDKCSMGMHINLKSEEEISSIEDIIVTNKCIKETINNV